LLERPFVLPNLAAVAAESVLKAATEGPVTGSPTSPSASSLEPPAGDGITNFIILRS
jgi:hypothetical protein